MISDKKSVQILVNLCEQYGIKNVVFSAGSRNAPLIISFNENPFFNCISIIDERSAAFYALGKAQQLNEPVIICCTSGSASLNYAPAISEAYYQHIPLLVITSDRPAKWLNNGEGQMIDQVNVFQNYIHHSYSLPIDGSGENTPLLETEINSALNNVKAIANNTVHLNIPLDEPLYKTMAIDAAYIPKYSPESREKNTLTDTEFNVISSKWKKATRILILCGVLEKSTELNNLLKQINENCAVTILTESTANINDLKFISSIDRTLTSIEENELTNYAPDLLITIGGAIISKKIKSFLRHNKAQEHWQISLEPLPTDTFTSLTKKLAISPLSFFSKIQLLEPNFESNFGSQWLQQSFLAQQRHEKFIIQCEWSDLKATSIIIDTLPDFSNLHMGNSSPVRYIQLFEQINTVQYNANRGVSGIDGCTSTMIGAASVNNNLTLLLSGDLSFVYDINALWNNHLTSNIRIIVINNSGGGIFRIIPGPSKTNQLEDFFEVGNNANIQQLVTAHNINYYAACNEVSLEEALPKFYNEQENKRPAVLEIFTPNEVNPVVLKSYFESIKNNSSTD
jgi:2-succinyl-5-enolpyruvyl-6-hydroxy-3-cyclohexene-1-carboxylate synthase